MIQRNNISSCESELINGIKFTGREVEIMSCIISGKSSKSISGLLNISPHTVNTHLRNIMLKLECSSKDHIIKFIESSNHYFTIRDKYLQLNLKRGFYKLLKDISNKITVRKLKCEIHVLENLETNIFNNVVADLALSGINTKLVFESAFSFDALSDCFHIIYNSENENIVELSTENSSVSIKQIEKNCIELCNINPKNYYQIILKCINEICKDSNITKLIDGFNESDVAKRDIEIFSNKKTSQGSKKIGIRDFRKHLSIIAISVIFCCLTAYYSFNNFSDVISNYSVLNGKTLLPRKNLIVELDKTFKNQDGIKFAILAGLGGAGKTTIAKLYLKLQNSKIAWEINSETQDSALKSFIDLSNTLAKTEEQRKDLSYVKAIQNYEEKQTQLIRFVFSMLKETKNWSLLFDNVEDWNTIKDFLPLDCNTCGNGKVVITTRNETLTNVAYFPVSCLIKVNNLDVQEKNDLFCNILYEGNKESSNKKLDEIEIFLKNIPAMPLDISAAAYYIKNLQISFKDYLNMTKKISRDFEDEKSRLLRENVSYSSTRYSIITSTFANFLKENPKIKDLLLFVCLIDSQNISKNYLRDCEDSLNVDNFIYNLRKNSLICGDENQFSIHKVTQEIGLNYVMSTLSDAEKEKYFGKVVSVMTQYTKIRLSANQAEAAIMMPHLQAMIKNIENSNLAKKDEYATKLLLSLFYVFDAIKPKKIATEIGEKILRTNKVNKYINDRDIAVLLAQLSYNYLYLGEVEKSKNAINECLKICDNVPNLLGIKAISLAYLGGLYSSFGNFSIGKPLLKKARKLIPQIEKPWNILAKMIICSQYSMCFSDFYINKKEVEEVINFLSNTLAFTGVPNLSNNSYDEVPFLAPNLMTRLVVIYNRLGKYDEAIKIGEKIHLDNQKWLDTGTGSLIRNVNFDIEYGYSLLRKNKLVEAYQALTNSINTKLQLEDNTHLVNAFNYRAEIQIRLGKFKEAYDDCKESIKMTYGIPEQRNIAKLLRITCHYNMSISKYKQGQIANSLKHFDEFFEKAKNFCEEFLDKDNLIQLKQVNVFSGNKDVQKCLKNSLEIFKIIYGEKDSFVRNYASKNY